MEQKSALNKRTILILCRGLKESSLLSQLKLKPQYRCVVASDDIRVKEFVKQYSWVDDVCWIEKMESFYNVASDVITILEAVNRWLESLANDRFGIPADLLFWIRHAEGGKTTQRIQDALLLIRSYIHLFDTHNVGRIVLLRDPNSIWEDDVLIQTARSRGIFVQEIGLFNQNKGLKYRIKGLILKAITYSKYFLRVPHHFYRIYKIIQVKYLQHSEHTVPTPSQNKIVFQLCSSGDNHVENIAPLMKALREKGYKPVALTWGATQGAEKVRQEGLHAEELEMFIPEGISWEVPYRVFFTQMKANRKIKQFLNLPELEYQSVPLGALLWPSIQYFLKSELSMRYLLDQALKEYFKYNNPVAINLWGSICLAEGFITWKSLNRAKRPLIFDYWPGVAIEWPYLPKEVATETDLFLAPGHIFKEYLQLYGYSPERIVVVGQGRYDHLADWVETNSADKSRAYLNIPSSYNIYVFYGPNATLRGCLTTQEQVLVTTALLGFAKQHPSAALIIKTHPTHQPGMLEQMIEYYSLPNVYLVDKNMLPYHSLNVADVVITKFSTIGIEAMLFGRPVISVILDNEERWQFVFQDAAEYVKTSATLEVLLEKLVDGTKFFSQWTEIQLKRQEHFLKQYFVQPHQPAALLAADAIASRLRGC